MNLPENRKESPAKAKKRLRSVSIFTYLNGLIGLSFAISCAMWVFLSLSMDDVLPPLLSRRASVLVFVSMFLLSLFCSVSAWISGSLASRLARDYGRRGHRRWRMGLYMGIFSTMLLIATFVLLTAYSLHVLMYRYHISFNERIL